MAFQKVEYEFPDPDKGEEVEVEIEPTNEQKVEKPSNVKKESNNELEIEIVDDVPEADRNRKPSEPPTEVTDEELEDYSEKVRNRIKHFSKGYHDERRAKEQALREQQELEELARRLVEENKQLKTSADSNKEILIAQAKKAIENETAAAKRAYKRAYEAGDSDKVLEAQEKLTNAKIKSEKLANFRPEPLQSEQDPVQTTTEQPVQPQVDTKALEWVKQNPWYNTNPEMTGYANGLHEKLKADGVVISSDEYYETINSRMRKFFPEEFGGEEVKPKRQSNVVAPATRSTSPNKVTLKKTQVAIAKKLGIPLEEYARHEAALRGKQNG